MSDVPLTTVTVLGIGASAGQELSCEVQKASITHGRDDPDSQPDASTVSLEMPLGLAEQVDIGARLYVDTGGQRRFSGKVTDVAVSWANRWDPDTDSYTVAPVAQVMAAGPLAELGARAVGDVPWPQELDGARAARILALVAGRIQDWAYSGAAPDGWWAEWLGVPGAASITADATMQALKVTWHPGSTHPGGFTWRYATPIVAGKTYALTAEVYVPTGMPDVQLIVMPVLGGPAIKAAERWQTVSLIWTADTSADKAVGVSIDVNDASRPAGKLCYIRRFSMYDADGPALGIVDPGTVQLLARDIDRQPAQEVLQSTASDARGVAWETRDGLLSYADNEHRRNIASSISLESCDVLMAPSWLKSKQGLVNDVGLGYGVAPEGGEQPVAVASSTASVARYGRYAYYAGTQLAALADASAIATLLVTRNSSPVWLLEAIELDLSILTPAQQAAVLALDMHALITVTGFPAGGPETSAVLWVEGWTEEIEHGSHSLALAVSGFCRTTPPPRWDDIPSTTTWDAVDAALTWDGTACLGPAASEGRWSDVSASLRWNQLAASVTWDTWPY